MKYLLSIAIGFGLVIGGYFGYGQLVGATTTTVNPFYCDTTATTSVNFIGIAAVQGYTTSVDCIVPVRDRDSMTFYTQMNASTTGSTLSIKAYGSYNEVDWYDIPNVTQDSGVQNTIASTTAAYPYAPQVSGFNRTTFQLDPKGFSVVKFTTTAGTASSSVWQMAVPTTDL